jgi:integrase
MGELNRAKKRISFTQNRVATLKPPATGRAYHYDTQVQGLCLCVTAAGARTFYLYKKIGGRAGRPVRVLLGKFPAVSVDDARTAALQAISDISKGKDPQQERLAKRHEQTLAGLWASWLEWAKEHKRSWKGDQWLYDAYLKGWAHRQLSAIRQSDVAALHAKVGKKHGRYSANRALALLRAMFNKAHHIGWKGDNPAKGVQRFKEEQRDRFLTADELPAFFDALNAEPNATLRDFFILALLTGARRANVQSMRWADVDLDRGLWRIPETKAGMPVVVPLVGSALKLLHERKRLTNGSAYVFPSHGRTGHIMDPKAAWKRILTKAGLEDVRIHDLRRTLGSWQALGGSSLQVIGKSLGHTQVSTTAIYARLTVDPVRESVGKATAAIWAAGKKKAQNGQQAIAVVAEPVDETSDQ